MIKTLTIAQFLPVRQRSGAIRVTSKNVTAVRPIAASTQSFSRPKVSRNWTPLLSYVFIGINVVLLGAHIAAANIYAVKGDEISKLKQKTSSLIEQNQKLTLKSAEVTSIVQMQESATLAHFIPVTGAEFLTQNTSPHITQR